ncbi:MAG: hypothetical protein QOG34_1080 [Frankiaceae bacterium]|nr:hypothetical protein [Frankiaceae bacterium]
MPTAAVASVPAALLAHAMDVAGWLPFVHETDDVRAAMGPLAVVLWLAFTAAAVGLATASRRPALLAAPASLASAGLPELIGRHDLGAVFEPGAILGALLQWSLLLVVLALAVVASEVLRLSPLATGGPRLRMPALASRPQRPPYLLTRWRLRSRAPPACPSH